MKTVKAQTRFDEVVTKEVLNQAIERGSRRAGIGVHATSVQYVAILESLLVGFADQSAVCLPVKNYPEFADLTEGELKGLELGFGGSALCSEVRDLHVSIAGLVSASQPLMDMAATLIAARNGGKSSHVKAQAARKNGKNGGRPRLVRADTASS
jgi:hypothetical protein